jgi:hypothetical protein
MSEKSIARHTSGELEVRFGDHLVPVEHSDRPIGGSTDFNESAAKYAHVVCITREICGIRGTKKIAAANAARIALTWNCHDDLLAALKGVLRVADRATDEFDAARAAIAKAEGAAQ